MDIRQNLRSFLYLNTSIVDDYLASLYGSVSIGPVEETETSGKKKGGGVNSGPAKLEYGANSSLAVTRSQLVNEAGKFQQLYAYLAERDVIRFINSVEDVFEDLEVNDIVEIDAEVALPEFLLATHGTKGLDSIVNAMSQVAEISNHETLNNREDLDRISILRDLLDSEETPIVFNVPEDYDYEFTATLKNSFLKVDPVDIQTNATVFGKVRKLLHEGDSVPLVSLDKGLDALIANQPDFQMTRRQKREAMKKLKKTDTTLEKVEGPGVVLLPIAIFV